MKIQAGSLRELKSDNFVKRFIIKNDKKLSYLFVYIVRAYIEEFLQLNPDDIESRKEIRFFIDKKVQDFKEWIKLKSEDEIFKKKNYYCVFGTGEEEARQDIETEYRDNIFD